MGESVRKNGSIDLTQGNITKGFLTFMVPVVLGNVFTQLYNMVDSIIVGQFVGGHALGAVGASFSLTMMINAFLIAVGAGATVIISQYFGARQQDGVDRTVNTALIIAAIVSIILTIMALATSRGVLTLMQTPANVFDDALAYYRIIILGTAGHLFYQMCNAILRGMGDSMWPLGLLIFCSFLNVGLDLLFVVTFNMGIAGAAWATILAQLISAIAVVWRLIGKRYNIKVNLKTLKLDPAIAKSMLKIGVPAGMQQLITSAGGAVVQSFTNQFGSVVMAANTSIIRIDGFIILPMMAIGTAITTYVGQNIGAHKPDRLKAGIRLSMLWSVGISVILGVLLVALAPWALKIFTTEAEIIEIGSVGLRILGLFYVFMAVGNCITGVVRGAGKTFIPMLAAIVSIILRIGLAYLLAVQPGDYRGLFYAMIIANGCNMIILILYYCFGNWKGASIVASSEAASI